MTSNLPNQKSTTDNAQPSAQGNQGTNVSVGHSGGKETEAISSSFHIEAVSAPEEHISKEVINNGIEVRPEKIDVPPDVAQLGVQPSGGQQQINPSMTQQVTVTLPISDDQVISGTKTGVGSSLTWLAIWCLRQLKRAHMKLKVIHGKVMRVKV